MQWSAIPNYPNAYEIGSRRLKLQVYKDNRLNIWYCNCQVLGIGNYPLKSIELALVKTESVSLCRDRLERLKNVIDLIEFSNKDVTLIGNEKD